MRAKLVGALLMLMISPCRARDPFFPPQASRCQPVAADSRWRLLGVIGRSDHYDAWLTTSAGHVLRRKTGDPLPGTRWRITRIDTRSTTLTSVQDCLPAQRLVLKGRYNAQDAWSVDDVN